MSDQVATSTMPSRSWRRERALRAARQRLKRLEIEAHRIKAELARLESANETDLANELAEELRFELGGKIDVAPLSMPVSRPRRSARTKERAVPGDSLAANFSTPAIRTAESRTPPGESANVRRRDQRPRTRIPSAWLASLGVHGLVLLLLAPLTYIIVANERVPLFASMFTPEPAEIDEIGTAPIELVSFEETELPADDKDMPTNLEENFTDELGTFDSQLEAEMATNSGQLNTLPTDVGTLMVGGGDENGGGQGLGGGRGAAGDEARLGRTNFFGTPARANRVVFLVDNSASMKQGRMETTLFELARSVEQLGEKQEFYVVFYSDQAYPMMYPTSEMKPLRATRENKQRLYQWLQTVELCVGGALLKAVALAESLEPEVVYLLSDGDITGTKTMEQLSQPGGRKFAIHTLGMGVKKPQDAQNLARIAQANRGTFQLVGTLPAAVQMAKARPLRSNSWGQAWGTAGPR